MPFKPVQTFPQGDPDVQLFFHGLLMLCPDTNGNQCRIGVHRLSVEHKLSIDVRAKGTELPDPPLLRLSGPLDSMGLTVAVEPETNAGVSMFVPTAEPFDRNADNDPRDFRWTIDLEQLDPAQPPMILDQSGISPGIVLKDGMFFTARITDPAKLEVKLTEQGAAATGLNRVARIIGANIYLNDGQKVVLRWFADGKKQELNLPKSDEGLSYLIYMDNSPSLMPTGKPTHSEFVEYARVVTNATDRTRRFDIDFNPIGLHQVNTDAAPCIGTVVGSGGGH
ncbi:MAG TPA: hypothetical protein VIW64_15085 [Pyrinomonadaceae bacterium]